MINCLVVYMLPILYVTLRVTFNTLWTQGGLAFLIQTEVCYFIFRVKFTLETLILHHIT